MAKTKVVMNGVEYEVDGICRNVRDIYVNIKQAGIFYIEESLDRIGCTFIGYYNKEGVSERLDGPARIYSNGHVVYALGYGDITKQEFYQRTSKLGRVLYGEGDKL